MYIIDDTSITVYHLLTFGLNNNVINKGFQPLVQLIFHFGFVNLISHDIENDDGM